MGNQLTSCTEKNQHHLLVRLLGSHLKKRKRRISFDTYWVQGTGGNLKNIENVQKSWESRMQAG